MKVKELLALLQECDPEADVAVYSYDEGDEGYWSAQEVIVQQLVATEYEGLMNYQDTQHNSLSLRKEQVPRTSVVTISPWNSK